MNIVFEFSVVEETENMWNRAAEIIDWGQRFAFMLPIIILIVLFIFTLFHFRNKCKKITERQINDYSLMGKYINGLFVELNESREYIRTFCFSKLWKQRIVHKYNSLFNDKMGRELLDVYQKNEIKLKLSYKNSEKEIRKEIGKTKDFLKKIDNREIVCNPDFKNTNMLYECYGGYTSKIKKIEKMASYLDSNYMVITGTAGNGKSMMLCSVAEQLVRGNESVLFLNARDIEENFISFLNKQVMFEKVKKLSGIWWGFQSIIHTVTKKRIYILVDAINENDSEAFLNSFSDDIEKLLGYKCVRVIISCRSEYFDLKYKKYVMNESLQHKGCYLDIQEGEYTYEARERLITNYAQHYSFKGELSEGVKEKIINQLLLVKILFEVYSGKKENIYELNKYELYKTYIDNQNNTEIEKMIKELALFMMESGKYENIPLVELECDSEKYKLIDSSILVCRKLVKYEGTLIEETEEVINFVYDEMRDYHLSRYMLMQCKDENGELDYDEVILSLENLMKKGAKCLEGIVNYLFNHFLYEKNSRMLDYLLFNVIKPRDSQIDEFRNRRSKNLKSWGLTLLLETDSIDTVWGERYIDFILDENPGKEGQRLLVYLLNQEYRNSKYTLHILLNAFLRSDGEDAFRRKLDNTIGSWQGEGVTVNRLISIHMHLSRVNRIGAERFSVYAFLILKSYKWKDSFRVENYFRYMCNFKMVDDYINRIRECIS